jgi:hypothetical protein
MTVTATPGALKKFRRTPWRFQQTIERPDASDLERFVSTIISAHGSLDGATVTIDAVIFDTVRISALCPAAETIAHDVSLVAESAEEAHALLVAALWDGPNFVCIPTPKPFVFYADHDDWITFYGNSKSHLNHVIEPLVSHGFKLVEHWQREL